MPHGSLRVMPRCLLALETSCDETAAAICTLDGELLSSRLFSQIEIHRVFGGVVPEVASRNHITQVRPLVKAVLEEAKVSLSDIDCFAATCGPGLVSSLLIGTSMAKALAVAESKPFLAVNHMEAHLLSPFIPLRRVEPALGLIVSGGHTMLVHLRGVADYAMLGSTRDDAAGEALDKTARMLGLPYPGGPEIERAAASGNGDPKAFSFPRSRFPEAPLDFSYSGLKTAVLYTLPKVNPAEPQTLANLCASIQEAVLEPLVERSILAAKQHHLSSIAVSGGVSCNKRLRSLLQQRCDAEGIRLLLAPPALCTDNAGMVAFAAAQRFLAGDRSDLSQEVDPNWRLAA
jgi:N6-L-threonylcarbamoyladenine synthase